MMQWNLPGGKFPRLYAHMADQPHVLIAGATSSGKSTVINGIILSLLHDAPDADEFVLIDTKRVELSEFRTLPHTRIYADTPADAVDALRRVLRTVDDRFKTMQRQGQREYQGSHVYVFVDELADLLTTSSVKRESEELLQRIAQVGRAARVHLICATQHVPVVPTSVRCNFDARLGLKVTTAQESRNIIMRTGAERLPSPRKAGKAYGFYLADGDCDLYELPRFSEDEHQRIVQHWQRNTRPARATA